MWFKTLAIWYLLSGCSTVEDRVTDLEVRIIDLENAVMELQDVITEMLPDGCEELLNEGDQD